MVIQQSGISQELMRGKTMNGFTCNRPNPHKSKTMAENLHIKLLLFFSDFQTFLKKIFPENGNLLQTYPGDV